ncbi:hypothetical protein [Citrobacter freundii]|uniref:hypothetical protein n=1 Tax=Citrobacter freundii TaxID=546 RepID=UPI002DBBDDAE|nr:hypothetical protein [Citrobacter freundii]MEB6425745.1 hypothetical protein [Citrobacter freundii]
MSGKTSKAAGQQKVKDGTGASSSPEVASTVITDGTGHEPSVTLPGHYVAVGSQSVSPVAHTAEGDSLTLQSSGKVILDTSGSVIVTAEHISIKPERVAVSASAPAFPQTDDVVALEVRAIPVGGFWRCGRFWPHDAVTVFASDAPEADNAASVIEGDVVVNCFISHADAARLKAESMLIVTVVDVVTEKP